MKRITHLNLATLGLIAMASLAFAVALATSATGAVFVPQAVTGFNQDVIANGSTTAALSTTTTMDTSNVLYSKDFTGASGYGGGFPTNGLITSAIGANNQYQLADYDANNVLIMKGQGTSGTLTLQNMNSFTQIGFLALSTEGNSSVSYTLNFAGGATQTGTLAISDWWSKDDSRRAIDGLGRVNRTSNAFSGLAGNPDLYEYIINIDVARQSEGLTSIAFSNNSTSTTTGFANIFAVSGDAVPEPSAALLGGLGALLLLRRRR